MLALGRPGPSRLRIPVDGPLGGALRRGVAAWLGALSRRLRAQRGVLVQREPDSGLRGVGAVVLSLPGHCARAADVTAVGAARLGAAPDQPERVLLKAAVAAQLPRKAPPQQLSTAAGSPCGTRSRPGSSSP